MDKEEQQNPEAGLFSVGEYYLKNKRFSQARYVFGRYLTYYPAGRNSAAAAKNLEAAELSLARTGGRSAASSGDDFAPSLPVEEPAAPPAQDLSDSAKAYYDAVSLISQQKYQQSYMAFKKIVDANADPEYVAKSVFEIGRCLYLLNKFDDCIKYYTMMITKYPKHPDLGDALFFMGQSYEKNNKKDQAATFYKKILSMGGDDEDGTHLKARRALKALEA
jgi:TolA-binding protein